jgi:hypothetical protein
MDRKHFKALLIVILMVHGFQLVGCLPHQPDVFVLAEFLLATSHSSFSEIMFSLPPNLKNKKFPVRE